MKKGSFVMETDFLEWMVVEQLCAEFGAWREHEKIYG